MSQRGYFYLCFIFIVIIVLSLTVAKASILNGILSLFNNSSDTTASADETLTDSDLLKPTIYSSLVNLFGNNSSTNTTSSEEELPINEDGTLIVSSGPMRSSTEKEKPINDSISLYEVKKGDTLASVADLFDVSVNTIVWANNLKNKNTKINPGDTLLIFPITGIQYIAKKNISLADVAKSYQADLIEIAEYNGISSDTKLAKGDSVFIPDAEGENVSYNTSVNNNTSSKNSKTNTNKNNTKKTNLPKYKNNYIAGYFMMPVSGCVKTQGLHGPYHTAVDFGCHVGTAAAAAAGGTVIRAASSGYNGGYGEVVIISHPNGTQSIYAHLSQVNVSVGQTVVQGQVIGATGNTGKSTGPHLHFETRGTGNPFG